MFAEIEFVEMEENKEFCDLIQIVVDKCFEEENIKNSNVYLNVILTQPQYIRSLNKQFRNIDKETDVLSFPMFEREEIETVIKSNLLKKDIIPEGAQEVLGDIVISIPRVEEQAKEYGHSVQRELAYMIVHGFYHIMGYDHMNDEEKKEMRSKEENVLEKLNITREWLRWIVIWY